MNTFTSSQHILRVIEFFDMFDYPVTTLEIQRFLEVPLTHEQIEALITTIPAIQSSQGYYFLINRAELVAKRLTSDFFLEEKLQKAKQTLFWIAQLPYVKSIALCNSMSFGCVQENSDIDVFIITQPKRLWITRGWAMLVTMLCGTRISKTHSSNRVCLSFFMTTEGKLSESALPGDSYLDFWMRAFLVVFGPNDFHDFMNKQGVPSASKQRIITHRFTLVRSVFYSTLLNVLGVFESLAGAIELRLMSKNKLTLARVPNTHVIINETMLKFHEVDLRLDYNNELAARLKKYA